MSAFARASQLGEEGCRAAPADRRAREVAFWQDGAWAVASRLEQQMAVGTNPLRGTT